MFNAPFLLRKEVKKARRKEGVKEEQIKEEISFYDLVLIGVAYVPESEFASFESLSKTNH